MSNRRLAILSRAAAYVFGDRTGAFGERGWTKGNYQERGYDRKGSRIVMCLNSALFTAERDLFGFHDDGEGGDNTSYDKAVLATDEGEDAKLLLAEVIYEQYPELINDHFGIDSERDDSFEVDKENAHTVIVTWNDAGFADEENMAKLLNKTEAVALDRWLEQHPVEFKTIDDILARTDTIPLS